MQLCKYYAGHEVIMIKCEYFVFSGLIVTVGFDKVRTDLDLKNIAKSFTQIPWRNENVRMWLLYGRCS